MANRTTTRLAIAPQHSVDNVRELVPSRIHYFPSYQALYEALSSRTPSHELHVEERRTQRTKDRYLLLKISLVGRPEDARPIVVPIPDSIRLDLFQLRVASGPNEDMGAKLDIPGISDDDATSNDWVTGLRAFYTFVQNTCTATRGLSCSNIPTFGSQFYLKTLPCKVSGQGTSQFDFYHRVIYPMVHAPGGASGGSVFLSSPTYITISQPNDENSAASFKIQTSLLGQVLKKSGPPLANVTPIVQRKRTKAADGPGAPKKPRGKAAANSPEGDEDLSDDGDSAVGQSQM